MTSIIQSNIFINTAQNFSKISPYLSFCLKIPVININHDNIAIIVVYVFGTDLLCYDGDRRA